MLETIVIAALLVAGVSLLGLIFKGPSRANFIVCFVGAMTMFFFAWYTKYSDKEENHAKKPTEITQSVDQQGGHS